MGQAACHIGVKAAEYREHEAGTASPTFETWHRICDLYGWPQTSRPAVAEDVGARVVTALGEPAARELLDALERSDADRAALIGRLHFRDEAAWLAEILMDLEDDVGEIARLRLVDALRREIGRT